MRERERLLEQQEPSATPDPAAQVVPAAPSTPVAPVAAPAPAMPPAPAPVPLQSMPVAPVQAAPAYSAPRPAGGYGDSPASFTVPPAAPQPAAPQPSQFAPRPAAAPAPVPAPQFGAPPGYEATTPERTLTRRELRAMLDGSQLDEFDLEDVEAEQAGGTRELPGIAVSSPATATPRHPSLPDASAAPSPATGHWTSQLNAPVETAEPFDQLLSRGGVSHGVPTTTNALILPSLPDQGSIGGTPLAASGEIIATGSIDLPRSYGATGVHPSRIDSSDVDRLFDQIEEVGTGAAPVAATRAISTQGASRAMIAPPKKEGMNVPLVLAVTAGVLALGVVATLVIGAMAGLF
ncbi:hypothetical protein ACWGST_16115 [Agromyces sp. NPDC055520]